MGFPVNKVVKPGCPGKLSSQECGKNLPGLFKGYTVSFLEA
jgi:hypothetical protein